MNTKQSVAQLAVPHRKRLSSTMVVALLLCVVAGAVMINAADFPATAIETFYACALIVLAVLLVIRDLLQARPASCANAQEKPAFRKTATGIAATAFYIVAMSYCGYLITTPVFLIVAAVKPPEYVCISKALQGLKGRDVFRQELYIHTILVHFHCANLSYCKLFHTEISFI